MFDLEEVTRLPDDFDGRVRLFPLPELVVFPHAMQPLHIFEPRYCEMLEESLATDRLIAMSTLTGGPKSMVNQEPPVATTVCLGRILSHVEVEGDRHNILLVGAKRAQIVRELDAGRSFRIAEVEVKDDVYSPDHAADRLQLKKDLLKAFGKVIPPVEGMEQNLHELLAGQMGLGPITDIISYTLPFEPEEKLELLAQHNVDQRAMDLVALLGSGRIKLKPDSDSDDDDGTSNHKNFPPPFSVN